MYFEIATTELALKIISDTINNYIGYAKSMKKRVPKIISSCSPADTKYFHIHQIHSSPTEINIVSLLVNLLFN